MFPFTLKSFKGYQEFLYSLLECKNITDTGNYMDSLSSHAVLDREGQNICRHLFALVTAGRRGPSKCLMGTGVGRVILSVRERVGEKYGDSQIID